MRQPPPMPAVRAAQWYVNDAIKALEDSKNAWNSTQMKIHLEAALSFLNASFAALNNTERN